MNELSQAIDFLQLSIQQIDSLCKPRNTLEEKAIEDWVKAPYTDDSLVREILAFRRISKDMHNLLTELIDINDDRTYKGW